MIRPTKGPARPRSRQDKSRGVAHIVERDGHQRSPEEERELQHRVLQDTASVTRSIADAVVLKEGDLFVLTEPGGFVPLDGAHGFGLYYHDCRYLNGYELQIAGARPDVLASTTAYGFMAVAQLTVPDIIMADGHLLPKDELAIKRERVIQPDRTALHDLLTFHNYGQEPIRFPVSLACRAEFEDIFAVRGLPQARQGQLREPEWRDDSLHFVYEGADAICRSLTVQFSRAPTRIEGTTAFFRITIPPRKNRSLLISLLAAESEDASAAQAARLERPDLGRVRTILQRSSDEWLAGETAITSSSLALNAIVDRSLRDLRVLRSRLGDREFFAAGVPWFATLFGRDSLITAIQTLAYDPRIAEQTLRVLAEYQGTEDAGWRDEEPGKILHELRLGEMARTGEIPHTPYYGTVDATPLFLILVGWHAAWTGDLELFRDLRPNVERALTWMACYADLDGDGYIEYRCRSEKGLTNQGWRDSGDGLPNVDGSLAQPPIALVEVQGYAYLAQRYMADLFRRAGEPERAADLEREAAELRQRFNHDFWLEERGHYALALQRNNKPVAVLSSNPGHALWSGIADHEKAEQTVRRLMAPDMFSGWGIRTLSERELRYNPTGYHLGTIWPHDNALIAAGFRRYGFDAAAARIFEGMVEAALRFPDYRLPELFMGFPREAYGVPVAYPVACRPQAWAAGTVPSLVCTMLGLSAEAFERRLRIVRPSLPPFIQHLEVRRLRVGDSYANLRFERTPSGNVAVDVLRIDGSLEIVMELGSTSD